MSLIDTEQALSGWRNRITGHGEEAPDQLLANPRNWRVHPKAQQEALAAVLDQVGWVQDVIVNQRTGHVMDGHARTALAISRREQSIPVVYIDVDEAEEKLILASLDPISVMATTDHDAMRALLAEISVDDEALLAMFEKVSPGKRNDGNTDPDAVPEASEQPYVQRGEVYLLGEHRIMCGDSTNPEDVARLMAGECAVLLANDPPYLVDYRGGNHPQSWANGNRPTKDKHWDDYHDPDAATDFFADFLRAWLTHCVENVPVYQWHATRRQALVEAARRETGLLVHQTLVWVKSRPILTRSDYMWQHEPCFYGWPRVTAPSASHRRTPRCTEHRDW
ncbi:MAG: DNA modification methylase [Dehalococcoidia bacterium]|nr:DNA modification methylase [Dehalococcoidia bacterium]